MIHTTIKRFTDVANARGLDKPRLVQTQHRQLQAPRNRGGGNFYGPVMTAVRQGLLAGDVDHCLEELVHTCTPGQHEHFAPVARGMYRLIHRLGVTGVVSARQGPWRHHSLEVNVSGLLGVRLSTGEQQAWVLHTHATPLDERGADIPLYVAAAMLAMRGSSLHARVVDVRRATAYAIHTPRQHHDLRQLAEAEAEAYLSLWRAAAA